MAIRFVQSETTKFHQDGGGVLKLLYGEEVETQGNVLADGQIRSIYRNRTGTVKNADLGGTRRLLEMYFIDVGQGDATFIVTPANKKILIDGGEGHEAYQFLEWKYRLDEDGNSVTIDLLVLSHADADHIEGMIQIIAHPRIHVSRIIHSGIAKYKKGVHDTILGDTAGSKQTRRLITRHNAITDLQRPELTRILAGWYDAVLAEQQDGGLVYEAVDATTGQINVGDPAVTLTVLGPRLVSDDAHGQVFDWMSSDGVTVNGNSVVLRLDHGNLRVLLPGDVNIQGSKHLLADPNIERELDAHVLKAPHHGSHEFHPPFLAAARPQLTVVSSGETTDHGHPRANFLGSMGKYSRGPEPLLFSTELVSLFEVDQDAAAPDADDPADPADPNLLGQARRRFKKRLNGLINVRSDGNQLFAARRISNNRTQFVTYMEPILGRDTSPD